MVENCLLYYCFEQIVVLIISSKDHLCGIVIYFLIRSRLGQTSIKTRLYIYPSRFFDSVHAINDSSRI